MFNTKSIFTTFKKCVSSELLFCLFNFYWQEISNSEEMEHITAADKTTKNTKTNIVNKHFHYIFIM